MILNVVFGLNNVSVEDLCGFGALKVIFGGVYGQIGAVFLLIHCLSTT